MENLSPALQQERRRCVVADAARKRSSHKWTGRGLPVPPSLLRRETEEFDILHDLLPPPAPPAPPAPSANSGSWTLSSSGSWALSSGSSPRTPGSSQAREVAVDDDGFEVYDPAAFEGSVTREDFVPDDFLETVTGAVKVLSVEQDRLHREQEASASSSQAREKGKAVVIYIDDDSDEE